MLDAQERIDDLQLMGRKIIQNPAAFCFGVDSVLLAHFARVKNQDRVLDLGTGSGVLPLILQAQTPDAHFTGVEIQPQIADMAARSVALNGLQAQIEILNLDLTQLPFKEKGPFSKPFDVVLSNPPYDELSGKFAPAQTAQTIARFEVACTLENIVATAARALRNRGRFVLVHKAERLVDILSCMRQYKVEPKRMCMVQSYAHSAPHLVLIEGMRNGRKPLKMLPNIILKNDDGTDSPHTRQIYGGLGIE